MAYTWAGKNGGGVAEVPRLGEDRQTGREKKGGCQDGSVWRKKIMWAKRKDSNNGVKRPRGRIQASTIGLWMEGEDDYGGWDWMGAGRRMVRLLS